MKMVAGRPFSRDFMSDTTQAMVVNEAATKLFGYAHPSEMIGRRFSQWGRQGTVIGVVKDFHYKSLQEKISPLTIRIEPERSNLITVKVDTKNLPATLRAIGSKWKELIPNKPFDYYFLDESFNRQYQSEDRFGKLFLDFSILAIFLSCLGLMGLASYSTLQRTKEIGIRKVIGAPVGSIVFLLSKDFLTLVVISFFIAAPVAWYLMHNWLERFAYRTGLYWWIFAVGGVMALLIAVLTVSFQAFRAATVSPTRSLASE
jgi:putative ABC transport system permease protein